MKELSDKLHEELVGRQCTNVRLVEWGTLILYLRVYSEGHTAPNETFWIDCAWRLRERERVLVGSLDEPDRVLPQLGRLIELELVDVRVDDTTRDLCLTFSHGLLVEAFCHSTEIEMWELRRSDGYRLGIGFGLELHETWGQ